MKKNLILLLVLVNFVFAGDFVGVGVNYLNNIKTDNTSGSGDSKRVYNDSKDPLTFKKAYGLKLMLGTEFNNNRMYVSLDYDEIKKETEYLDTAKKYTYKAPFYRVLFNFDFKESFLNPAFELYVGANAGYGVLDLSKYKMFEKTNKDLSFSKFGKAKGFIYGGGLGAIFSMSKSSKIDFSYKMQLTTLKAKTNMYIPSSRELGFDLKRFSVMNLSYIYQF